VNITPHPFRDHHISAKTISSLNADMADWAQSAGLTILPYAKIYLIMGHLHLMDVMEAIVLTSTQKFAKTRSYIENV